MKHLENFFFLVFFFVALSSEVWMTKFHQATGFVPTLPQAIMASAAILTFLLGGGFLIKVIKNRRPKSYYHKVVR